MIKVISLEHCYAEILSYVSAITKVQNLITVWIWKKHLHDSFWRLFSISFVKGFLYMCFSSIYLIQITKPVYRYTLYLSQITIVLDPILLKSIGAKSKWLHRVNYTIQNSSFLHAFNKILNLCIWIVNVPLRHLPHSCFRKSISFPYYKIFWLQHTIWQ